MHSAGSAATLRLSFLPRSRTDLDDRLSLILGVGKPNVTMS